MSTTDLSPVTEAALEAHRRGYVPVVVNGKRPTMSGWQELEWADEEHIIEEFRRAEGLGLRQGEGGAGLVSVDLDDERAHRVARVLPWLPTTSMVTGRASNRDAQHWYQCDDSWIPGTKQYKDPNGKMLIEFRSSLAQTVIPPSIHPDGEPYRWERDAWGPPATVMGAEIAARTALIAMVALLIDVWPEEGSRHAACLALAGGLLRDRETGRLDEVWAEHAADVVEGVARVNGDEEAYARRKDVETTIKAIANGKKIQGWNTLREMVSDDRYIDLAIAAKQSFRDYVTGQQVAEIIEPTSPPDRPLPSISIVDTEQVEEVVIPEDETAAESFGAKDASALLDLADSSPERLPWNQREDGAGMFGPGMLVGVYGPPEAGKSLLTIHAAVDAVKQGGMALLVNLDAGAISTARKVRAFVNSAGLEGDELTRLLMVGGEQPLPCDNDQTMKRWVAAIKSIRSKLPEGAPFLIIIDHLTGLGRRMRQQGYDVSTNNNDDSAALHAPWHQIKDATDACVVILDHQSLKGDSTAPMGSTNKIGELDLSFRLEQKERATMKREGRIVLYVAKDREAMLTDLEVPSSRKFAEAIVTRHSERSTSVRLAVPARAGHFDADGNLVEPGAGDDDLLSIEITDEAVERAEREEQGQKKWELVQGLIQMAIRDEEGLNKTKLTETVQELFKDNVAGTGVSTRVSDEYIAKAVGDLTAAKKIHSTKSGSSLCYFLGTGRLDD